MPETRRPEPEFIARKEVGSFFPGANPKALANLNSRGLGPKPYKGDGRLVFHKYTALLKHYTGQGE